MGVLVLFEAALVLRPSCCIDPIHGKMQAFVFPNTAEPSLNAAKGRVQVLGIRYVSCFDGEGRSKLRISVVIRNA
jgi:hypothetical protein